MEHNDAEDSANTPVEHKPRLVGSLLLLTVFAGLSAVWSMRMPWLGSNLGGGHATCSVRETGLEVYTPDGVVAAPAGGCASAWQIVHPAQLGDELGHLAVNAAGGPALQSTLGIPTMVALLLVALFFVMLTTVTRHVLLLLPALPMLMSARAAAHLPGRFGPADADLVAMSGADVYQASVALTMLALACAGGYAMAYKRGRIGEVLSRLKGFAGSFAPRQTADA